jgi:hypothetical protein
MRRARRPSQALRCERRKAAGYAEHLPPAARNRFLHFKCLPQGRHEKRRAGAIRPCTDNALAWNAAYLSRDRSHGRAPGLFEPRPGGLVKCCLP